VDNDHSASEGEDQEDSGSDTASVNSKSQRIPSRETSWYVGRFCKANAETAHSLIHWKFALKGWVDDQLEAEGQLEGDKLEKRVKMKSKALSIYANAIVDRWESEGQIRDLYRDFKNNLEQARQGKQDRWRTSRG